MISAGFLFGIGFMIAGWVLIIGLNILIKMGKFIVWLAKEPSPPSIPPNWQLVTDAREQSWQSLKKWRRQIL